VRATTYTGRFAPSPTGALHAGSLVAALASWLDARAQHGQWLVRIEDVDRTRCLPGMDRLILQQLAACGLHSDLEPVYQSRRSGLYQKALDSLTARQLAYPCACTRKDIENALTRSGRHKQRHGELIYPGTCRDGLHGMTARASRLDVGKCLQNMASGLIDKAQLALINRATFIPKMSSNLIYWYDRRLGQQQQDVAAEVGDFVLKRADNCFAYQLAVVVDDAAQGVTDIVRGEDLADNTARQIVLQSALSLPTPRYLHSTLVRGPDGDKLSKQNSALPVATGDPMAALSAAARILGLSAHAGPVSAALLAWTGQWLALYPAA